MVLRVNGSLTRGDFFQQKKLKTVEDGQLQKGGQVVSSGSCRSSLRRPLEIFGELEFS